MFPTVRHNRFGKTHQRQWLMILLAHYFRHCFTFFPKWYYLCFNPPRSAVKHIDILYSLLVDYQRNLHMLHFVVRAHPPSKLISATFFCIQKCFIIMNSKHYKFTWNPLSYSSRTVKYNYKKCFWVVKTKVK